MKYKLLFCIPHNDSIYRFFEGNLYDCTNWYMDDDDEEIVDPFPEDLSRWKIVRECLYVKHAHEFDDDIKWHRCDSPEDMELRRLIEAELAVMDMLRE